MKQRKILKQLTNKEHGCALAACLLISAMLVVLGLAFPSVANGGDTAESAFVQPAQPFSTAEIGFELGYLDWGTPTATTGPMPFSVMKNQGIPQLDVSITEAGLQLFVTMANPGRRGAGEAAMNSAASGLGTDGVSTDREESGVENDAADSAAVWASRYPLNFVYRFLVGVKFSIEYNDVNRQDVIAPVGFDVVDFAGDHKALKVSVGHFFENAIFHASVSASQFGDQGVNAQGDLEKYNVTVYWRPSGQVDRGGYFWAEHQDLSMTQERPAQVGFVATYRLNSAVSFDTNFEQTGSESNQWIAGLNYALPNHHLLCLRARYLHNSGSGVEDTTAVMLTYTIPFGRR